MIVALSEMSFCINLLILRLRMRFLPCFAVGLVFPPICVFFFSFIKFYAIILSHFVIASLSPPIFHVM